MSSKIHASYTKPPQHILQLNSIQFARWYFYFFTHNSRKQSKYQRNSFSAKNQKIKNKFILRIITSHDKTFLHLRWLNTFVLLQKMIWFIMYKNHRKRHSYIWNIDTLYIQIKGCFRSHLEASISKKSGSNNWNVGGAAITNKNIFKSKRNLIK